MLFDQNMGDTMLVCTASQLESESDGFTTHSLLPKDISEWLMDWKKNIADFIVSDTMQV